MLVNERNSWNQEFKDGKIRDIKVLEDYRINRNSESWRSSRLVEQLCEYILFLENQNKVLTHDKKTI